jgi:hypothetical protein
MATRGDVAKGLDAPVTFGVKVLSMKSPLPDDVHGRLVRFARALEDGLQADAHKVGQAVAVDDSFDHGFVTSPLIRALVLKAARHARIPGLRAIELSNGGCELVIMYDRVEYHFRLRKAKFDRYGLLDVRTSSDSLITRRAAAHRFLDDDLEIVTEFQDTAADGGAVGWILAYVLNPATGTLGNIAAALPVGLLNDHSPYRLQLQHTTWLSFQAPPSGGFRTSSDDLDLGDEDEGQQGEASG